jgi:NAD(P)-dependent dehydrogenase (short-subunit alcohol dehydrogenase family)
MPDSSSPLALANLFGLDGKVAVVTGGSRGIGFMIASGLVTNGVRTYITARKADACDAE